jgi:hypothetical protein
MIPRSPLNITTPGLLPEFPNICLSGVAGTGKTSFLGSVGAGGKALIVDVEDGTVSFHSPWYRAQEGSAKLENLHILRPDGATKAHEVIHLIDSALDHLIRTKNSDGYSVFAVDSITELQELFISLHGANDPRQSYGAFKDALHGVVLKARRAPIITIFTARLKVATDDVLNREVVRPAMSPGSWEVVSGLFDLIGQLDVRTQGVTTRRTLSFNPTPRFQGKDRVGIPDLAEPTFVQLQAAIKAAREDAPAPAAARPARPAAPAARRQAA